MTTWELHGRSMANCNCATGCPCQFMALPTNGNCEAVAGFEFERGHHGDVDLGGTRAALVVHWPGAIHEGNGTMQVVIDERASPAQREALHRILTGEDTEDMATFWWVFSKMSPNKLETLYRPIHFELDYDGRTGRMSVPGVFETEVEPLRNPVTGAEHRARIDMPNGFEFRVAEVARGSTRTSGAIELPDNRGSHAHIVDLHIAGTGVLAAA